MFGKTLTTAHELISPLTGPHCLLQEDKLRDIFSQNPDMKGGIIRSSDRSDSSS